MMRNIPVKILIAAALVCSLLVLHLIGYRRKIPTQPDVPRSVHRIPSTQGTLVLETCKRNASAANITGFDSLPANIKDFLYYQHCRHFPLLLDSPNKCGGAERSQEVFLLLVIKSSPGNYERREVLRKTWAKDRQHAGVWIRRVFISGTSGDGFHKARMNKLLALEQQEHGDIVQWDFTDTFFNLTLKQVLFLQWRDKNCPNAQFLFNGDDDVFAHTENMVNYLQSLKDDNGDKHLFTGHLIQNVGPIRESYSKYYVPVQVQESDSYPPYCGGGGFLLSRYTASIIYRMSQSILIHPIDDVYMGMCLAKAGLKPTSHMGVKTAGLAIPSQKLDGLDPCFYQEVLLVHRFLPADLYLMWRRVNDPQLDCNVKRIQKFT